MENDTKQENTDSSLQKDKVGSILAKTERSDNEFLVGLLILRQNQANTNLAIKRKVEEEFGAIFISLTRPQLTFSVAEKLSSPHFVD